MCRPSPSEGASAPRATAAAVAASSTAWGVRLRPAKYRTTRVVLEPPESPVCVPDSRGRCTCVSLSRRKCDASVCADVVADWRR